MKRILFVLIVSVLPIFQALAQSGVNNDTQQAIENTQRFMQELERLEESMPAKLTAQAEERKRKETIKRQRLAQEAEQRKRQEAFDQIVAQEAEQKKRQIDPHTIILDW